MPGSELQSWCPWLVSTLSIGSAYVLPAEAVPTFEASLAARAGNTDCIFFMSLLLSYQLLLFHSSEQARRPGTE